MRVNSLRRSRVLTAVLVSVLLVINLQPIESATTNATCGFVLGFATVRALVGAQVVGNCLENEWFNPTNGNAEQRTAGGLLVWRKADNWTAFTDVYRTWVNGPNGVQQRLSRDRFAWEAEEPAG